MIYVISTDVSQVSKLDEDVQTNVRFISGSGNLYYCKGKNSGMFLISGAFIIRFDPVLASS